MREAEVTSAEDRRLTMASDHQAESMRETTNDAQIGPLPIAACALPAQVTL
jgi:hypothetical protein